MDFAAALLNSFKDYGAAAGIIVVLTLVTGYFIHRGMTKEDRLQKQLDELHKEIRESIVPVLIQCRDALTGCKEVVAQNSRVIERLIGDSN